jgi:ankyrin repeat protein
MRFPGLRMLAVGLVIAAGLGAAVHFASRAEKLTGDEAAAAGLELVEAARLGDVTKARGLIERGADVNALSADGTSALHWAVHLGDEETARLLLRHGAHHDQMNSYGLAPLHVAAGEGRASLVQILLEAGASTKLQGRNGETALLMAARKGCAQCVRLLLAKGSDVNARDETFDLTPLMLAAWSGSAQGVSALIEAGADVHATTRLGPEPKFVEPNAGRASHGDGILRGGVPERGSRPPRAGQMTALHYAAREGHTAVAKLLLGTGRVSSRPRPMACGRCCSRS